MICMSDCKLLSIQITLTKVHFIFGIRRKQHELNLLAQLNEAKTNVAECQQKIADLTYQISELERDLTVKSWNVDRECSFGSSSFFILQQMTPCFSLIETFFFCPRFDGRITSRTGSRVQGIELRQRQIEKSRE